MQQAAPSKGKTTIIQVLVNMQVIKLTLIYGILGLEQQFSGGSLSIAQLRQLCEKGGAQLVVERNLPGLQRQILNLQTNLDAVFDRLAVEVRTATSTAVTGAMHAVGTVKLSFLCTQPRISLVQHMFACLIVV
jgi:hypothetical protein